MLVRQPGDVHTSTFHQICNHSWSCRTSPNAPKFDDRSQEETEWQEQGAREAAWKLAKGALKLKEKHKATFFSLLEIGAYLHQLLNLRNQNLLSTSVRRCI